MSQPNPHPKPYHVAWIFPGSLDKLLNVAPKIEMTRELRNLGWQVTLLTGGKTAGNRSIEGVEVTSIPHTDKYLIRHIGFHLGLYRYLFKHWKEIDFIYFQGVALPWMLPLRFLRILLGQKRPLFVHDTRTIPMEVMKKTVKDRLRGQYMNLMSVLSRNFVDGHTAITRRMAEALQLPADKLWGIWPSGVNLNEFLHAEENRRWPQCDEPVQIGYIGVLAYERNLMAMCQAVEQANKEGMCFEFSIVGDGREREALKAFAAQTNGRIRILPQVPHDQVPQVLAKMHVGTLPFPDQHQFRVSSPIKLFEYMGSGMVVLATRIACHTDVIGDQPCAFWAEDSNVEGLTAALRQVWQNRSALPQMGRSATEAAQDFTWAASAKKLAAALEYGITKNNDH